MGDFERTVGQEILIQLDLFSGASVGIDPLTCDYSESYFEFAMNGQKVYNLKLYGLKYLQTSITTSGVINFYIIPKCNGQKIKVYCERCQIVLNPDINILFANSNYQIPTVSQNEPIQVISSKLEYQKGTNFVLDILF